MSNLHGSALLLHQAASALAASPGVVWTANSSRSELTSLPLRRVTLVCLGRDSENSFCVLKPNRYCLQSYSLFAVVGDLGPSFLLVELLLFSVNVETKSLSPRRSIESGP